MGLQDGTKHIGAAPADARTRDPLHVLDTIRSSHEPAVYVLKDFHVFLNQTYPHASTVIRKLRDLADTLHTAYATVILLSPVLQLPDEMQKDVTVMDYELPVLRELDGLLTRAIDSVRGQEGVETNLSAERREHVLKAALGLTLTEAENVFAKCIVEKGSFDVDLIVAEKQQLIRKSGVLEYFQSSEHVRDIGGLEILKAWLDNRSLAFTEKAQKFGLPAPRGILLLGVQGCGKKTKPVFVVATANDISQLPPELLRKGRFDDIFFVDLPVESERREIFAIHLAKRNRTPEDFDLERLAAESDGFSGAEIEQAVVSGLYTAFEQEREVTTDDVLAALKQTVPLSVTMREEIGMVRRWAKGRARPASPHALADVALEEGDGLDGQTTWVSPAVWARPPPPSSAS